MEENFVQDALLSLGCKENDFDIHGTTDGSSKLVRGVNGKFAALARRGELYDLLAVGINPECPVGTLREFLEIAVMPISDEFAGDIGLAKAEREKLRKRIREATVALDVLAKGQNVRVRQADIAIHSRITQFLKSSRDVETAPDELSNDLALVNQLERQVLTWRTEMQRLAKLSNSGLQGELTIEEELSFWSSLDAALATAQSELDSPAVKLSSLILSRNRRAINFVADMTNSLHMSRLRAGGVLNLVQSLPIVNLRTSDSEEAVLIAAKLFWDHMLAKLPVSSLPVDRVMSLVDAMSVEVGISLKGIQISRGGLLNVSTDDLKDFSVKSQSVFRTWMDAYDTFRKAARNYATKRGEKLPERKSPAFVALRKRIDEALDFVLHRTALRNVLTKQLNVDLSAARFLEQLDLAYKDVLVCCENGIALDITDAGNQAWTHAREQYSAATEDIENSIALHFHETVCEMSDLTAIALFARDYSELVDKSFMESATGACTSHVLSAANKNVVSLCKRWDSYKPSSTASCEHWHFPRICTSLMQAKVVNLALQETLESVKGILGPLRMEHDQDVVEHVQKVNAVLEQTKAEDFFRQWEKIASNVSFQPSTPLISCLGHNAEPRIGMAESIVTTLNAVFFFESDFTLGVTLNKDLLNRARSSRFILHVYYFLNSALDCYNHAHSLLSNLDEDTLTGTLPLICDTQHEARKALTTCARLQWNSPNSDQLCTSKTAFDACCRYVDKVQAILDEHRNIIRAFKDASNLCIDPNLVPDSKQSLEDSMKRANSAAKSIRSRIEDPSVFQSYISEVLIMLLNQSFDSCLANSLRKWAVEAESGTISSLSSTLRLSANGNRVEVEPNLHTVHSNALSSLGELMNCAHDLFSKSTTFEAGEPLEADIVRSLSEASLPNSTSRNALAFAVKEIENQIRKLDATASEWGSVSYLLGIDSTKLLTDVSKNTVRAYTAFSELDSLESQVTELELKNNKTGNRSLYLDVSDASSIVLSNTRNLKREVLETCSDFCANQSHVTFKTISLAKAGIKGAVGNSPVDDFLLLQSIQDSVLRDCEEKIAALACLEVAIRNHGDLSLPSTWIGSDVLEAEFNMLCTMHKKKKSKINVKEVQVKFRKDKMAFSDSLTSLFNRIDSVWTSFGSNSQDTLDSTVAKLKGEIGRLQGTGCKIGTIENALKLDSSDSQAVLTGIMEKANHVCSSLKKLCQVEQGLVNVGATSFEDFNPRKVREDVDSAVVKLEYLLNTHGTSKLVEKLDSVAKQHLRVHGLIGKLRDCRLSTPREKDVLEKLFKRQGCASLMQVTIQDFWDAEILENEKYIREVLDAASGEDALAEFMSSVRESWTGKELNFVDVDGVQVVDGIQASMDELQDQLLSLTTMANSQFVGLFEEERKSWELRLTRCLEVLEQVAEFQTQWLYLRTLFNSGGSGSSSLRRKLQKEFLSFSNVDLQILSLFDDLKQSPGLVEGLNALAGLDRILSDLNEIVRGLSHFLEGQRTAFPRFFFLSDSDLLVTLSINPQRIEDLNHILGKLFPGVAQLEYENYKDGVSVCGLVSKEGERFALTTPVVFDDGTSIPDFFSRLEQGIQVTLRTSLSEALPVSRSALYEQNHPNKNSLVTCVTREISQISLLTARIVFTEQVESCLAGSSSETLTYIHSALSQSLKSLCNYSCTDKGSNKSDALGKKKIKHFIKELVYQRDTVARLIERKVVEVTAFDWSHELRIYAVLDCNVTEVEVRCAEASFVYGWEYLGVGDTLVQTPLTQRCYLTLLSALHRGFGGSPFGPAGTGKTETVKSLGRFLGRNVVVFNCDESFDEIAVGRILAGAARLGFWVCFDEFNRLSSSILSATSQQLSILQNAVKRGTCEVENFYGGESPVAVVEGVGIFITTNPTYSGRRELPSNLKSLFRPCAMSSPDSVDIGDVLLMSSGFQYSRSISLKLVHLFECMKKAVRPLSHYDFGLRSLKSCILVAGHLRNTLFSSSDSSSSNIAEVDEEFSAVLALHETLKPRLIREDVLEYQAYILNLFPKVTAHASQVPESLRREISAVCQEKNLKLSNSFFERIGQLFNLLKHRSGVIIVGETGCGKSTAWKVLYDSIRRVLYDSVDRALSSYTREKSSSLSVLDAKLLSSAQLYGSLDRTTREWTDGIFTKILRDCAQQGKTEFPFDFLHWIVFDGDIDPNWVENLNSVLDDTQLLTLPSGERIPLASNVRILFEVDSLAHANPSTVSRCGLVYCDFVEDPADLFMLQLEKSMSNLSIEKSLQQSVLNLAVAFCSFVQRMEQFGKGILQQPLSFCGSRTASVFASLLQQVQVQFSEEVLANCFLFAAKTSLGSKFTCEVEQQVYSLFFEHMRGHTACFNLAINKFNAASFRDALFDSPSCTIQSILEIAAEEVVLERLPDDIGSPDIVVPTPSSTRLSHIVRSMLCNKRDSFTTHPISILCGPPGCGKSMVLSAALNSTPGIDLATISLSSRTSVEDLISVLKSHMEVSRGLNGEMILSPIAPSNTTVLFCDEVNLGEPDEYGTQHVASFLRGLIENNGFWMGTPPQWTKVEGLRVFAACNPAEDAGRHELPNRLMRHALVVCVEQPDRSDLMTIFKVHVSAFLKYLNKRLESQAFALTSAMVDFFLANKERFCPASYGPKEPHYIYSARELIRWIRGMKRLLVMKSSDEVLVTSNVSSGLEELWEDVLYAFSHEAKRLFIDRLVSSDESEAAESLLAGVMRKHFGYSGDVVPDAVYTTWMKSGNEDSIESRGLFEKVESVDEFRTFIYRKLRVFAEEEGLGGSWVSGRGVAAREDAIDQFAVTDDVVRHLVRIERVLSQPLGHAVLMGVPGTGKKTLARFVAWMMGASVFQVRSHASYTADDFANDLRHVLRTVGIAHKPVVVIFDESNDLDSAFLEMMNSILACGDVPGLFEGEHRTALLKDLQEATHRTGIADASSDTLYASFLDGVREYLHVIFSIPIVKHQGRDSESCTSSGSRRDLTSRSPALYNRCVVDWFGDWDLDTLESIADLKLEIVEVTKKTELAYAAASIHEIAKATYARLNTCSTGVTPRHYLEFIEQFNRIAHEKGNEITERSCRLGEGLAKLQDASTAIDSLKESLMVKTEHLKAKEAAASETLKIMSEEQRMAEKSKIEAEKLAVAAEDAAVAARTQQEAVAQELATVEPQVEEAREAVGSISKKNLDELRAMPNPPAHVRTAMDIVLYLLDGASKPPSTSFSWGQIRTRMRSADFITSILNFDVTSLSIKAREKVEDKIQNCGNFDVDRVQFASNAAGPLAKWVEASLNYAAVVESVDPLRQEVIALEDEQAALVDQSEQARNDVLLLENRIDEYRSKYALLVAEAERLRSSILDSNHSVVQAEKMLDSLGGEWDRWNADYRKCDKDADLVWGNAIYAAAFVAYAGPLDRSARRRICKEWVEAIKVGQTVFDENLDLSIYLSTPGDRALWTRHNLSVDENNLENYAILLRSARYPLIVDPTGNSAELLRKVLGLKEDEASNVNGRIQSKRGSIVFNSSSKLSVTSFEFTGKRSYLRTLESSVRFGTTLLIENASRFDNTCLPLLGQESSFGNRGDPDQELTFRTAASSQQRLVRLGDRDIPLSPGFRMFMSTSNVHDVSFPSVARCSVVSFVLSPAALHAKCVHRSMKFLHPTIEQQRMSYMVASATFQEQKRELEDSLLIAIQKADDVGKQLMKGTLLETLSRLKAETARVEKQEEENKIRAIEAEAYEQKYQELANGCLKLFEVLENLQCLNELYRFSPSEFFGLFEESLSRISKESCSTTLSPTRIFLDLVRDVYLYVVPTLFPQHKTAFACALITAASQYKDARSGQCFTNVEIAGLRSFLANAKQLDFVLETSVIQDPKYESLVRSIQAKPRGDDCVIDCAEKFGGILEACYTDTGKLPKSFDGLGAAIPGGFETLHGPSTRGDVVLSSHMESIALNAQNSAANIREHSRFRALLLCSRGANSDPCELTANAARQRSVPIESIALSNEYTPEKIGSILASAAHRAEREPFVLLLKNLHVANRKCIERLKRELGSCPQGFSYLLVLAVEVGDASSQIIYDLAVDCRVLAFEIPPALRTNLSRCHAVLNASFNGDEWLRRCYIAITWLHVALLERSQYSPVGFSKAYNFSEGDLVSSWDIVTAMHKSGVLRFDEGSVERIIQILFVTVYGGRVETKADSAVLFEFIRDLFNRVLVQVSEREVVVVSGTAAREAVSISLDDPLMIQAEKSFPLLAPTDWFGMPESTGRSFVEREGKNIMDVYLALTLSKIEADARLRDSTSALDYSSAVQVVRSLLELLPILTIREGDNTDFSSALQRYFKREEELCTECIRLLGNDLQVVLRSLEKGSHDTSRLQTVFRAVRTWNSAATATIPAEWDYLRKYSAFTNSVRVLFVKLKTCFDWIQLRRGIGRTIDISKTLRPSSLITAIGLHSANNCGIAEHQLQPTILRSSVEDDTWTFHGLSISGAKWSAEEPFIVASDEPERGLGDCHIRWLDEKAKTSVQEKNKCKFLTLPLYDSHARSQLVAQVHVPMDPRVPLSYWKLSAVALIISTTSSS